MKRLVAIGLLALSLCLPIELRAFTVKGDARFESRPYTAQSGLYYSDRCVLQFSARVGTTPAKADKWILSVGDGSIVEYDYKLGRNNFAGVYFVQIVKAGGYAVGDSFTLPLKANNSSRAKGAVIVTVTASDLAAFSATDAKTCVK